MCGKFDDEVKNSKYIPFHLTGPCWVELNYNDHQTSLVGMTRVFTKTTRSLIGCTNSRNSHFPTFFLIADKML